MISFISEMNNTNSSILFLHQRLSYKNYYPGCQVFLRYKMNKDGGSFYLCFIGKNKKDKKH